MWGWQRTHRLCARDSASHPYPAARDGTPGGVTSILASRRSSRGVCCLLQVCSAVAYLKKIYLKVDEIYHVC